MATTSHPLTPRDAAERGNSCFWTRKSLVGEVLFRPTIGSDSLSWSSPQSVWTQTSGLLPKKIENFEYPPPSEIRVTKTSGKEKHLACK